MMRFVGGNVFKDVISCFKVSVVNSSDSFRLDFYGI